VTGMSAEALPAVVAWPLLIAVAALFGSFLNVCISRLPLRESIVFPGSHCPRCQAPIRYYDNVPVLSFALLGGRCRACRRPISWRYPVVEILTVSVSVLVVATLGPSWEAARAILLGLALIAVTFTDFEHLLIPDRITLPGIVVGLVTQLYPAPRALLGGIIGTLLAGAVFYGIAVASQGGMGGGDVKLAAMIGAFLGWQRVLVAIFLAVVGGGIVAVGLLLARRKGRKDPLPFGPFLALGGLLSALWGSTLLRWYLG
jgi:leader peptidase (prepilin peptidase) / N-methyltransferase